MSMFYLYLNAFFTSWPGDYRCKLAFWTILFQTFFNHVLRNCIVPYQINQSSQNFQNIKYKTAKSDGCRYLHCINWKFGFSSVSRIVFLFACSVSLKCKLKHYPMFLCGLNIIPQHKLKIVWETALMVKWMQARCCSRFNTIPFKKSKKFHIHRNDRKVKPKGHQTYVQSHITHTRLQNNSNTTVRRWRNSTAVVRPANTSV